MSCDDAERDRLRIAADQCAEPGVRVRLQELLEDDADQEVSRIIVVQDDAGDTDSVMRAAHVAGLLHRVRPRSSRGVATVRGKLHRGAQGRCEGDLVGCKGRGFVASASAAPCQALVERLVTGARWSASPLGR